MSIRTPDNEAKDRHSDDDNSKSTSQSLNGDTVMQTTATDLPVPQLPLITDAQPKDEHASNPDFEPVSELPDIVAKEDFSIFTTNQKRCMILAAAFAAWFSPMTGSIYYPALNQIAADLHVTSTKINITVTTYLIIQGLAPMMIAGFSDKAGRRPAYVICFAIYIVSNIVLALQNNYAALLVFRMVQAAGSSGTVALANGLVGDCVTSAERGQYVAFTSIGSILGPAVSPIFGGLLSQYLGWHWIFWFLLILSATFFVPYFLFQPETCRNLVGDGSIPPPRTSWNVTDVIRFKNRAKKGISVDEEKLRKLRQNYKITIPNPLMTLRVLAQPETALLLLSSGFAFACFYAISTGTSTTFGEIYGYNDLLISLMFLPLAGGSIISAFTTGRLIDWNYRRLARRLNFPVHKNRQTDLSDFPIEFARLQLSIPMFVSGAVFLIAYGWMLNYEISVAGPCVMLFFMGYCLIAQSQCLNVLMVDLHPGKPAVATAANNVVRCLLGAAFSAAIVPMSNAMGRGWAYTTLALIFLAATAGPIYCAAHGIDMRRRQKQRDVRKMEAKLRKRAEQAERKAARNAEKGSSA